MDWSEEDNKRALSEGWELRNGYVRSTYDHKGVPHFISHYEVVAHLHESAKFSEWHKNLYLNLPWTAADEWLARNENWYIDLSSGAIASKFRGIWESLEKANEAAQAFVLSEAQKGNPLHIKALAYSAKKKLLGGQ